MVGSWYPTHATKNVVWIFTPPLFCFHFAEENARIMHEQTCRTKSILNAYAWWCNDSCKMGGRNMITDKCRNDMFIMMPWRYAYALHDMNAFTGTRARKIISSYLHIWGVQCPMCVVKKVIWIFRLPMTKDETNIQCVCDDMMQMRKSITWGCTQYGNIHK